MVAWGRTMQLTTGMYRDSPLASPVLVPLETGMNSSSWYKPTLCIPNGAFPSSQCPYDVGTLPFTVEGACVEVGD